MHRILPLAALTLAVALTGTATAQSTADTIQATQPKMVKIFGSGGFKKLFSYSTGFLVSPEGHIVTVWSHVLDGDTVTVILNDGRKFDAKVLDAEPQLDLAVLKIVPPTEDVQLQLPFFKLDELGDAGPGTRILAFSNMFKVATGDEPVSVLHGVVAAKTKLQGRVGTFEVPYDGPVYVVDAITNNPGAGGGVLMSRDGKLLGMLGKEIRDRHSNVWINYTIPMTELKQPIEDMIAGRYTSPEKPEKENPRHYTASDFGIILVPDILQRTPPYIETVLPESLAAEKGLQRDDLVLFVNDDLIQSVKMFNDTLGWLEQADTMRLVVRRGQKLISVTLLVPKMRERPAPVAQPAETSPDRDE